HFRANARDIPRASANSLSVRNNLSYLLIRSINLHTPCYKRAYAEEGGRKRCAGSYCRDGVYRLFETGPVGDHSRPAVAVLIRRCDQWMVLGGRPMFVIIVSSSCHGVAGSLRAKTHIDNCPHFFVAASG